MEGFVKKLLSLGDIIGTPLGYATVINVVDGAFWTYKAKLSDDQGWIYTNKKIDKFVRFERFLDPFEPGQYVSFAESKVLPPVQPSKGSYVPSPNAINPPQAPADSEPPWSLEWYPPQNVNSKETLYYLEFHETNHSHTWTLFKSNPVPVECQTPLCKSYHPYNLGGGSVDREDCVSMNTKTFLKFMVDALNEKTERDT